ncbi:hypothetical protein CRUP_002085 [Coryphaenoides rupestris]|nr:hypothetical protein CRUP_002085 [Coryphaenoides rupestris]
MSSHAPDSSALYIREGGQLRRVSDIVLAEPRPVASCRRTKPLLLRKEHFVFTYNSKGNLQYSPRSLFDISLQFIAENIHHVDSLLDFPEQIGVKLFAATEEKCVFSNQETGLKALQVFNDAYGDMVLTSLCLRNRFPLLSERMSEIKTFHCLKSLDLFGCRLGDSHEIFQHLTNSSLTRSLVELFIGGNCLSDIGLQRLTAPIRIFKKGLDNLQLLDLSALKKTMYELTGLVCSEKPLDIFEHSRCKTEGWAEHVVNQWETIASQVPKLKKIEDSRKSALRFFGRQKFISDVLNSMPVVRQNEDEGETEKLHFYKPAPKHAAPEMLDCSRLTLVGSGPASSSFSSRPVEVTMSREDAGFGLIEVFTVANKLADGEEAAAPLTRIQLVLLPNHSDRIRLTIITIIIIVIL